MDKVNSLKNKDNGSRPSFVDLLRKHHDELSLGKSSIAVMFFRYWLIPFIIAVAFFVFLNYVDTPKHSIVKAIMLSISLMFFGAIHFYLSVYGLIKSTSGSSSFKGIAIAAVSILSFLLMVAYALLTISFLFFSA